MSEQGRYNDVPLPQLVPMLKKDSYDVARSLEDRLKESPDADTLPLSREAVEGIRALLSINGVIISMLAEDHRLLLQSLEKVQAAFNSITDVKKEGNPT